MQEISQVQIDLLIDLFKVNLITLTLVLTSLALLVRLIWRERSRRADLIREIENNMRAYHRSQLK